MAEMTIRLITNPDTGKKDIVVKLHSDPDSLPHEHEQLHKQLVEKLIEGGTIKASDSGNLVIEREEHQEAVPTSQTEQGQREALSDGAS